MDRKLTLLIDTSLKGVSLCLGWVQEESFEVLSSQSFFSNQVAAAKLAGVVEDLLQFHDLNLGQLNVLAVSRGPGSFTGIKVGISFCTALSSTLPNCKLTGFSPLEALAKNDPKVAWFLPATKSQGYLAVAKEGNVEILIVDIVDGELELYKEDSREKVPLEVFSEMAFRSMLEWPALEQVFKRRSFPLGLEPLVSAAVISQTAVFSEIAALDPDQIESENNIEPRYVRKSAPEEKLAKKGL